MLRIGLTGGIGSGKSTVARIFEVIGIPVYYADIAGRQLMNHDPEVRAAIINAFGEESYQGTEIDRSFLVSEVFYNHANLEKLNNIIHPAVFKDFNSWTERQTSPYAIKEAAIIFETGGEKFLDYIIGVSAPEDLRIKRLKKRDGKTDDEIRFWMNKQMDADKKMSLCDFVIVNDEKEMLIPQVLKIHQEFLQESKKK